jgi:hypothetical protein
MLSVTMTRFRRPAFRPLAALAAASLLTVLAQARTNPYDVIVERNPFGLKPVPPPVPETNQAAATPPVKIVLTGITSMFGPNSKRAFLEMTEQQPAGKPAGTPIRAMLGEGDREGDIEVVSINIEQNIVKIRNGTIESELTFEVPKSTPTPTGRAAPNTAAATSPAAPASSQPIIISSSESRGGVTMAGGGGGFEGNSAGVTSFGGSTPMVAGNSGGISSYGGVSPAGGPGFGSLANPALGNSPGSLASIPSRTIRTPLTVGQTKAIDPEQQMLMMEANRIRNEQVAQNLKARGMGPPPLPPTPLSRELYGSGPPPLPGH